MNVHALCKVWQAYFGRCDRWRQGLQWRVLLERGAASGLVNEPGREKKVGEWMS